MRFLGRKQGKINATAITKAIIGTFRSLDYARGFAWALHPNGQRQLAWDPGFGGEVVAARVVLRREAEALLCAGATADTAAKVAKHQQEQLFSEENGSSHEWGMDGAAPQMRGFDSSGEVPEMAREAHLEAAKQHLEAASKHFAAVDRYNEDDPMGAERFSDEARVASQYADSKSIEAHRKAMMVAKMKLV